jgi:hypothetical protein
VILPLSQRPTQRIWGAPRPTYAILIAHWESSRLSSFKESNFKLLIQLEAEKYMMDVISWQARDMHPTKINTTVMYFERALTTNTLLSVVLARFYIVWIITIEIISTETGTRRLELMFADICGDRLGWKWNDKLEVLNGRIKVWNRRKKKESDCFVFKVQLMIIANM